MKKLHKKNFLMVLLLAATLISCGSDDDDNDDTPERQEDTTGSNGTTGSSGTSGTTGGTPTACLSSSKREHIRTFLNRLSDLRTFNGTGTNFKFEPPDSEETRNIAGTFIFSQTSEKSWKVNWDYSDVNDPTFQDVDSQTFAFDRNNCLTINGARARNVLATDSTLSYRYSIGPANIIDSTSLSSGKLKIRSTVIEGRNTIQRFNFVQD